MEQQSQELGFSGRLGTGEICLILQSCKWNTPGSGLPAGSATPTHARISPYGPTHISLYGHMDGSNAF